MVKPRAVHKDDGWYWLTCDSVLVGPYDTEELADAFGPEVDYLQQCQG